MKKFLFVFSVLFLILFTFTINCFASSEFPEVPQGMPTWSSSEYNYYVVVSDNDTGYPVLYHFGFNYDIGSCNAVISDDNVISFTFDKEGICTKAKVNNGVWKYDSYVSSVGKNTPIKLGSLSLLYSDFDIYDTDGKLFFHQTPLARAILAPIVEGTETKKTLAEVVGILPKILVVVVSFLGLRKALRMLSALLHRS